MNLLGPLVISNPSNFNFLFILPVLQVDNKCIPSRLRVNWWSGGLICFVTPTYKSTDNWIYDQCTLDSFFFIKKKVSSIPYDMWTRKLHKGHDGHNQINCFIHQYRKTRVIILPWILCIHSFVRIRAFEFVYYSFFQLVCSSF